MGKWYNKYLSVFEKPFDEVPPQVVSEIKSKIATMQSEQPVASVVVIAHNEETRLLSCLWSLSENKCKYPIEIIGVNNNSKDRTGEVFEAIGLPTFFENKCSCGYARRCGLENARGKYYICIDSDTMYPPHYIETVIENLEKPGVMAVSSFWSYIPDKNHSYWGLKFYEFFRDIHIRTLFVKRPELAVRGLVFAYRIEYGRKVGYRVELIRGEDGTMAFGLKNYGEIKLIRSSKTRAVTASNTLDSDGSLFRNFLKKAWVAVKRFPIRKKTFYKDKEENLISSFRKNQEAE